jgi:hypothetical protein
VPPKRKCASSSAGDRRRAAHGAPTVANAIAGDRHRAARPAHRATMEMTMRFMMLMIPKGYEKEVPQAMPDAEAVGAMMKYNEELRKAGVLLALDGLQPPATGKRVTFSGGKHKVTDGPFAETKEAIGGYWVIRCKSQDEAVGWATRCPVSGDAVIEIRRVHEFADFPADVQQAAAKFPDVQGQHGAQSAAS